MDRQELIDILKSGQRGYPNSTLYYNDVNYVNLIENFLLYTKHVGNVSDNANNYAQINKEDKKKRELDLKLIAILDKNRDEMWEKIKNYGNT